MNGIIAPIIRREVRLIARHKHQALMVESVTGRQRARTERPPARPVAGNGRWIAGCRSSSDRMVSLGYGSRVLAASWLYWSAACKFMVMFLQCEQRQRHCCLGWHQSLTSCRCGCSSSSQPSLDPRAFQRVSSPLVRVWMSSLLLFTFNWLSITSIILVLLILNMLLWYDLIWYDYYPCFKQTSRCQVRMAQTLKLHLSQDQDFLIRLSYRFLEIKATFLSSKT